MSPQMKKLSILGIRGIPAAHGGFETFAEYLSLYLVSKGWEVTVYCQVEEGEVSSTVWNGVNLINIPVKQGGSLGTVIFDFKSIVASLKSDDIILTLGYNTAIFNVLHSITRRKNIINMDGIEWKRDKWGKVAKGWFWINERLGCWFGSHLIADHPKIKTHLESRVNSEKITMIPYGAKFIDNVGSESLNKLGLRKKEYLIIIARAEPENSILEIVTGFSNQKRDVKLLILGNYDFVNNSYHKLIQKAANEEVIFAGAIYDSAVVSELRFHALAYIHGHRVGGTNPSLVEALGAGNAVIAHDNEFNRWVVGEETMFFSDAESCSEKIGMIISSQDLAQRMRHSSISKYRANFTWENVLQSYEELLLAWARK